MAKQHIPVEPMAYTVPQTAEALGLSVSAVYDMLAKGELPWVLIKNKKRVLKTDLERWLQHLTRSTQVIDQTETELAQERIQ